MPAGAPDGMVRYEPAAQVVVLPLAGEMHAPEVRLAKLPAAQEPPLTLVHWNGCPFVVHETQPLQALRLPVQVGGGGGPLAHVKAPLMHWMVWGAVHVGGVPAQLLAAWHEVRPVFGVTPPPLHCETVALDPGPP